MLPSSPIADGIDLRPVQVRHLPVIREAIDRLGIYDTTLDCLPADPRMVANDADCLAVMILNILHGRVALYKMGDWLKTTDVDVIVGEGCPPSAFSDARLADTLDRIWEYGTDNLFSEVAFRYLQREDGPSEYSVHQDTTTLKLEGAYELEMDGPCPARGFSKDHRPDLKQLVYGLVLQGTTTVPLCVNVLDGNASEQEANRLHLDQLASLLPPADDVTVVADCKLVDAETLGRVREADFHFISLVPRTFRIREDLVEKVNEDKLELSVLATVPGRRASDPPKLYRGASFEAPFDLGSEGPEQTCRFLVVQSTRLVERFEKSLPDKLAKARAKLEKKARKLEKRRFVCEPDAEKAARHEFGKPAFHQVEVSIHEEKRKLPRPRRGRPRKGEEAPVEVSYRVVLEEIRDEPESIERARRHAGFFVLVTDHLDRQAWPDERILHEYRQQHIVEGHTGFRWLKGPAKAAPLFLKTPSRIAALGMVFVLALMVRNYMQYTIRTGLAADATTLPNMNNQPTAKPTTEAAMRHFDTVFTTIIEMDGVVIERRVCGLSEHGRQVLHLLGFTPELFDRPRKKWGPTAGGT